MAFNFKIGWRKAKAFAIKDFKNQFRFKVSLLNHLLDPVLAVTAFFVTYTAVFFGGNIEDLGYVQKSNYVIYLLTGFLAYSAFRMAWKRTTLSGEKYMLTLEGILLSPGGRWYYLFGRALIALIDVVIILVLFGSTIWLLHPQVNIPNLIYGSISLVLLYVIFISLDFIVSGIEIAEEGIAGFIRTYAPKAFLLIGCVYFPIDILPSFLRPIVYINPLYHAVNLFRSAFMQADLSFGMNNSLIYLIVLACILPPLAIRVFSWIFKKWGIRGY